MGASCPGKGILPPTPPYPILSEERQEIAREYLIFSNNLLIIIINNSIRSDKKICISCVYKDFGVWEENDKVTLAWPQPHGVKRIIRKKTYITSVQITENINLS